MQDNNAQLQLDKISYFRKYTLTFVTLLFNTDLSESLESFLALLLAAGFKSELARAPKDPPVKIVVKEGNNCIVKVLEEKEPSPVIAVAFARRPKRSTTRLLDFLTTHSIFCAENSQANTLLREGCGRFFNNEFLNSDRDRIHPLKTEREMLLREMERLEKYNLSTGKYLTPGEPVTGIRFTRNGK